MTRRTAWEQGFSLIELLLVVALIGILAAVAMVSYGHFTDTAKGVEAEAALAEVNRLEQLYHAHHGLYSSNLNAIGFTHASALKFYRIEVQVYSGGAAFQVLAFPLAPAGSPQIALALHRAPDGRVSMMKGDPMTLAAHLASVSSEPGQAVATPTTSGGGPVGTGGQGKLSCANGGDATVASDGLLDMNFCLK